MLSLQPQHAFASPPHPTGIVHRDLKSQNILIDRRYNTKVTDFGCSKLRSTLRTAGFDVRISSGYERQTLRNSVCCQARGLTYD